MTKTRRRPKRRSRTPQVFAKILLFTALLILCAFLLGRFGWRAFGFALCDDPGANFIESVSVADDAVSVSGGTADSFSAYVGSVSTVSDGALRLGIKHNAFLGFFRRLGGFSLTIPTKGQIVSSVYLVNGSNERLVWTSESGLIRADATAGEPGETVSDEPTTEPTLEPAQTTPAVLPIYPYDDADGANDLCAVVFLGYDEAAANAALEKLAGASEPLRAALDAGELASFDANGAEQYLILPKYLGSTVTAVRVRLDDAGELIPDGEPFSTQAPLRLYANYSDIFPSAAITVTCGESAVAFHPFISLKDGVIAEIDGAYAVMG